MVFTSFYFGRRYKLLVTAVYAMPYVAGACIAAMLAVGFLVSDMTIAVTAIAVLAAVAIGLLAWWVKLPTKVENRHMELMILGEATARKVAAAKRRARRPLRGRRMNSKEEL